MLVRIFIENLAGTNRGDLFWETALIKNIKYYVTFEFISNIWYIVEKLLYMNYDLYTFKIKKETIFKLWQVEIPNTLEFLPNLVVNHVYVFFMFFQLYRTLPKCNKFRP